VTALATRTDDALARGLAARARGALVEAGSAARELVDAAPDDPQGWVLLGSLAHLRGGLDEATTLYRRALAVAPTDPCAHAALAVTLTQAGQPVSARAHFAAALGGGGLDAWSLLRTLRQARELGHGGAPRAWEACATPLFEARAGLSSGTCELPQRTGIVKWTVADLAAALRDKPRVVALTGAGISAASGLETRKQLWRRFTRDEAVSAVRFHADPTTLWTVIREFWGARTPEPNPAHLALARLPGLRAVVTQNVDGLHQAAATRTDVPVHELHGTLLRTYCITCGRQGGPAPALAHGVPRCTCGAVMRPDVVLFGERVPAKVLAAAAAAVADADLLLVIGCAMDVSPASELPLLTRATVVEIKRRPSRLAQVVRVHHVAGPAEAVLPALEEAT
jgi:NAD-dependent deacetylase